MHYNSPEFWLAESRSGRYASLWHTGLNLYKEMYCECQYVGKGVVLTTLAP